MPTTYDYFVTPRVYVSAGASGCLHVAWFWHKRSHGKSELIRNKAPTVKLLQKQEDLTELEKKLLQNFGDMLLDMNILGKT